ncbi:28 kDa ribonucleoprotein, chloroplastic [Dorcoceras hygrometricum]|uniref:28 kDa ribonucleoprotein, chloroplastic n=1 Tax=Dorcoceras hygrometricum TaxID=472368 RepID=A0A2Z7DEF4_9LAMI|nr:28 kDa ribonucleoprotein, chloroplastic [Dorcoceras hygrometricum]
MICMRAIKDRIARPVYQLEIISVSLYTRTVYQPGKSSVRDLQSPHDSSVGQSQRGVQSGHLSICQQAQDVCMDAIHKSMLGAYKSQIKAVQSCTNSYLQQLISTSTDSQGTAQQIEASQPSPATAITVETPWNSNPKAHNTHRTLCQISPEIFANQQLHALFHKSFYSL